MLKNSIYSTIRNSRSLLNTPDISLLCTRLAGLQLRSLHAATIDKPEEQTKQKVSKQLSKDPVPTSIVQASLSPLELLRQEALKVENAYTLRPRCVWLKEEDEKLLRMVKEHGKRWSFISRHFVDRSPSTVLNRYELLADGLGRGPWTPKEVEALKSLGRGRSPDDIDDWETIQKSLPVLRPLFLIKQKYTYSLNPSIRLGHWTKEESELLTKLITQFGEKNMEKIAQGIKTRTKRQCLERWRWQMGDHMKGRFSDKEDLQILEAVKKYGENFAVIKRVIGSERTARHISQHYRNMLAPGIDRSPWTQEEQIRVYETLEKNGGDMLKTKAELNTNRAIRDLWNHYFAQKNARTFHQKSEKIKHKKL